MDTIALGLRFNTAEKHVLLSAVLHGCSCTELRSGSSVDTCHTSHRLRDSLCKGTFARPPWHPVTSTVMDTLTFALLHFVRVTTFREEPNLQLSGIGKPCGL